jgi:hypothetical protein
MRTECQPQNMAEDEVYHLEDLAVSGKMLLKWILNEEFGRTLTALLWRLKSSVMLNRADWFTDRYGLTPYKTLLFTTTNVTASKLVTH